MPHEKELGMVLNRKHLNHPLLQTKIKNNQKKRKYIRMQIEQSENNIHTQ